jgi:caa(3)-type oxidase subunit IV
MAEMTYEQKIKTYVRVAIILAVVTSVEVALTFVPHAEQPMKAIVTMGIVLLSCSKAFFVAYYYMHLNHEQKWTKIVAAAPLGMLLYTAALIADMPSRPESRYVGEEPRLNVYPTNEVIEQQKARKAESKRAATEATEEGQAWE